MSTFTTTKSAILPELTLLSAVLASKESMPICSMVKVQCGETLRLTATDMNITISSEIAITSEPWEFCAPLRQLLALVRLFNDTDAITFTSRPNDRVEVKWGKSRHVLVGAEAGKFPATDAVGVSETFTVDGDSFRNGLSLVLPHVCALDTQWSLQGVNLELKDNTLDLTTSNIQTLATVGVHVDTSLELSVLVPTLAATAISQLAGERLTISISDSHIVASGDGRTLTARRASGKFPNWRVMVPKDIPYSVQIPVEALSAAVRRASLTQEIRRIEKQNCTAGLRLVFTADTLLIESRENDRGAGEETIAITSNLNGESISVGIDADYLMAMVRGGSETITCGLKDEKQQLLFTDGGWRYVVALRKLQ